MPLTLSKREFLKTCAACAGVAALGSVSKAVKSVPLPAFPPEPSGPSGLWKWSREMTYYIDTPRGLKCQVCPNACILVEGGAESICKNKVVKDGKLYTIAYGNPCAVHVDPIEKKPLFHFLPTTTAYSLAIAGCNFACLNCQNWEISQTSPKKTTNEDLMPAAAVEATMAAGCRSIAYTYSEPVSFFEYTRDTARLARGKGIRNVFISNGYINEIPLRDVARYLDAANINLKSFSDEIYTRLNAGTLQPVLNTLKTLKEMGVWLEITNLVIPTWTDKPDMIRQMCDWLATNGFTGTPLHFNRFFPLYKLTNLPFTPEEILFKAREIALKAGIQYVYIGNVPGSGEINTYCPNCKNMVVERKGFTVVSNNLTSKGICKFCATPVPGVWS
jgi:pyruvate formate lyase activating enzyme